MTPEQFFEEIIRQYQIARLPTLKDPRNQKFVKRGESRQISSESEDLLAEYIFTNCGHATLMRTNQNLFLPENAGGGERLQFKPDIVKIEGEQITRLLDVKMDLGRARKGLLKIARQHENEAVKSRGRECTLRDGLDRSKHTYQFSNELTYDIVILSGENINQQLLTKQITEASACRPVVHTFVLSSGVHPNTYDFEGRDVLSHINIHQSEFDRLRARVCKPKRGFVSALLGRGG